VTPRTKHRSQPLTADTPLSPREQAFVAEYTTDFNPSRAAAAVGYKSTGGVLSVVASKVLARPHVQAAIQRTLQARGERLEATAEHTIREIARVAFSDIGHYFDEHENLKAVRQLSPGARAAIASIKVVKKNLTAGDHAVEYVHELKLWNKNQALELLAKHLGLIDGEPAQPAASVPAFALPPETPGVRVH